MDAWFPFGWKWKKELEKSSYSVWAIDELKRYIVGRLYPKKSGSVEDFITFVGDFRRIMNQFSKINPDNNFMFSVAADISTDVLDLLSYKTLLGNDVDSNDYGYKLHLVYGCLASPSEKGYSTVNDSPEAITLSWEFSTTPVEIATLIDGKKLKHSNPRSHCPTFSVR